MLSSIAVYVCFAYVAVLFTCHIIDCWQHPHAIELRKFDRKLAAPVEAIAPAVESPVLLLPSVAESHPFETSLERMADIEPIAAVHLPVAEVAPQTEEEIELMPVKVAPHVESDEAIDLSAMTIRELKALARERQLKKYCNFTKAELIAALSA